MGGISGEVGGVEEVDIDVCVNSYRGCTKLSISPEPLVGLTSDFQRV